ncbi:MAG: nucleotide sugar dehydrogenase [Candidatus Hermodarchaeota archaeon]
MDNTVTINRTGFIDILYLNEGLRVKNINITVMGLGYIGLPLSVLLTETGYSIHGVDINKDKIMRLKNGEVIIQEKEFSDHFISAWESGRLTFKTNVEPSDAFIIAVPTPLNYKSHDADLSYVKDALSSILPYLSPSNLIILESTVPTFTCRRVIKKTIENKTPFRVPKDILVAHCPERAYPGNLVHELIYNDRIIGGISLDSAKSAATIYKSFVKGRIFLTDDITAEMVKLAENTYRDINIAYANELRMICDQIGVNHKKVIQLANHHPRVQILSSGIGVGGHCIPIDPWFLYKSEPNISRLIPLAREINDNMPVFITEKIMNLIPSDHPRPKVIIVGKTYKPDVADIRESPALKIIDTIKTKRSDAKIIAVDPYIDNFSIYEIINIAESADLIIVLVPHQEVVKYIKERKTEILGRMRAPNIIFINEI